MFCTQYPDKFKIYVAEDDEGDRVLYKLAFDELKIPEKLMLFDDGDELISKLKTIDPEYYPALITLDFNMPKKSGFETLQELKADRHLRVIPVVMISTSATDLDVLRCYEAGSTAFITKAASYEDLIRKVSLLHDFFLTAVVLPPLENK